MRIIHSSDWHLGQSFFNQSRAEEHKKLIRWLTEQVQLHHVDAVIISGDVFDTGTPPSYARSLYSELILAMQSVDCQLVITAGNHDSVATLSEIKQLVKALNCHIVSQVSEQLDEQIIPITRQQQILGYVCAIPFLRNRDITHSQAGESIKDKQVNLANAIYQHFELTYQAAKSLQTSPQQPIIMTGHLTAIGATSSDSVRDIYIGQVAGINAHQLPNADYIALGHIHSAQKVGQQGHVYYSGSPLPLSFDELKQPKSVNLVSFDETNDAEVTQLKVPNFQSLKYIRGDLKTIEIALKQFNNRNDSTWLSIEVVSDDYITDLQNTIMALTQDYPVEVLQLKRARQASTGLQQEKHESLSEITPLEVFEKRLSHEVFHSTSEIARKQRLTEHFKQLLAESEEH